MNQATIKLLEKLKQHNCIYYMQLALRECLATGRPVCWLNECIGFNYKKENNDGLNIQVG